MRSVGTREADGMAENTEVPLDRAQVKKAVQALQAFLKSKSRSDVLQLDDTEPISLLFTLWKIPRQTQTIRIPLPHAHRSASGDVCLLTRDEPRMSAEQSQRFYRKLLEQRGVSLVSEIIPFKTLKKEYKPYEAKRRLLGNFDVFLCDERIRRLLPSHLGKHFYATKKMPISINLQSNNLGQIVQRLVQGTRLTVNNKGSCSMARVAHANMAADEVTDNVEAAVRTAAAKLRTKGSVVKVIHLKSLTSVALPIYTSDLSRVGVLQRSKEKDEEGDETTKEQSDDEEEDEAPQLVAMETPSRRPRTEVGGSSSLRSVCSARRRHQVDPFHLLVFQKSTRKKPMQKPTRPAAPKKVTTGSKVTKVTATRKAAHKGRRK